MPSIRNVLLSTALTATLAGAAGLANAAPRAADPFTDGARVGARDVYTDGARVGARDPFTDGSRAVHDARNPFSDGA